MGEIQDINVEISEETISVEIVEETIEANLSETEISVTVAEETIECLISEEVIEVELGTEDIVVEVENWSCPEIIESGSGGGFIFITDVTTSGSSGDKVYEPDTVPANYVLTSLTVDNASCEVFFIAEGGENYSPTVTIDGVECTNLTEISQDKRVFSGSIPVTVDESGDFTVESSTGKEATVTINRAAAPPDVLSVIIGSYPGIQTAAKAGDLITVSGTVDTDAVQVRLKGEGAFQDSGWIACSGGTFSISGSVSSLSGLQNATVYARNAIGSEGPETVSSNQIVLDQAVPTFTDEGVTFPSGQSAFKGTETGIQRTIVSDFTNIVYSSPHGDFSMSETAVYVADKEITCTNPGDYNDSSVNFRIYAYKASNDTDATFEKIIEVADVAPVVTVTQPQTRLRSSESGQTYTITASSNQNLADTPSLTIPVSGTWQGSGFAGGPKIFTRSILITDDDVKGEGAWSFDGTAPTNKAGLSATITGNQNVGGFVARNITLPAFGTTVELGTEVVDTSKLVLTWNVKSPMNFQAIGTSAPVVSGWTIDAVNTNPTQIIILDTQAASASSQASTLNVQETV